MKKSEVSYGEFKTNQVIVIHTLDKEGKRKPYPFSMGVVKAKLILEHLEEIKAFVKEQTK